MPTKVKLNNNKGLVEKRPGLDVGSGKCVFPFNYKDKLYKTCFKGKQGDWCATKINKKTKKIKTWAYCGKKESSKKPSSKKPATKKKLVLKKEPATKKKLVLKKEPATKKKLVLKKEPATKKKLVLKKEPATKKKLVLKKEPATKKSFTLNDISEEYRGTEINITKPPRYVLNNKKAFVNWFDSTYKKYRIKKETEFKKTTKFDYFNHQKIIRDYINNNSPYRGLLLYHGLGVGKTCGSIAIAESFRSSRPIIVMLNKSLRENFRDNLKFCGFDFFRTNQHWVFHKFTEKDPMKEYAKHMKIKIKRDLMGAWFIDFQKEPNFESLTKKQQEQINSQINDLIDTRYRFINLDGLNEKKLKKMKEDREFDNSVLIIDEVHNLTNAMSKISPGIRATYLENIIMDAHNLKLVFLSGTPMINTLFETAKLFNMLRGYIKTFEVTINTKSSVNWEIIEKMLSDSNIIDQHFVDRKNKTISVTRVPQGFVKTLNGVTNLPGSNTYDEKEFKQFLSSFLPDNSISVKNYTAFPNREEDFMKLFFDNTTNEFKNRELFKSRIIGLVSYYRTQDKRLIPTVRTNEIVEVPMSEYQFLNYSKIRKQEIENDKMRSKKSKKKGNDDIYEIKSSYRAYSRMHCSFVFPEKIPRPYPTDENGEIIDELETESDEAAQKKERLKKYESEKTKTLKLLEKTKDQFLISNDSNKLDKYSPKYNEILSNINKNIGLSFIYTEYKTLEGIAVLSIVLKANGFAPFLIEKDKNGDYMQIFESPEDKDKPKYAFWGGGKPEESELIRKIFNNEFEELPKPLKKQIEKSTKTNIRGETVKILLTTKTGAEGIDLKNVRQVHIVEPYWNPVRIKQVKGRAVRVGSHIQLPEKERFVDIFMYISIIPPDLKKTDRIIQMDKNGSTSDEVLFELSQKKLRVMETLLTLIKEASIDCSLNFKDTFSPDDPFKCVNYGSSSQMLNSYVPDITKQPEDKDVSRKIRTTIWKPKIVTLKIKGKQEKFALKPAPPGDPQLLFDIDMLRESGRPGEPLGELRVTSGKQTVVFY